MLGVSAGCVSPAMSTSPPPAPPPPAARPHPFSINGCSRCRFATIATPTHSRRANSASHHGDMSRHGSYGTQANSYTGYDPRSRLQEEEDSACPALLEREFHSLHRNVPALRRAGVDTNAIRQHFYPDGGWGWIVCGVSFLAHVLTTGFQLSYGLLQLYAIPHLGHEMATETGWLGAASWSVSMLSATIVVALCRRKSTRLTAVLGGLVLALGILFTSFATQLHQAAFSYGIVVGVGASMVRESAAVMLGLYFKRRRQFVEMVTLSGEGIGVALFSVILKEGVGKMGWRLGLQAVTGFVALSFFMGLLYRPASLYHPQRRAILHLKNQRKKVKEKKTHVRTPKPPFLDFTPCKSSTVRILIVSASVAALGIYTPIFYMSLHGYQESYDMQDLVLVQTFLGLSVAVGVVASGSAINRVCQLSYRKFSISRQYVCQGCLTLAAISILILSAASGYRSLCLLAWTYGLGLGGYRYTLKMLALERVRAKHFTKSWSFIKSAESLPVLLGVPMAAFLNDASHRYGRAGYYICSAATAIASILLFFVGYPDGRQNFSKYSANGSITSHCTGPVSSTECPDLLNRSCSSRFGAPWYHSPYTTLTNGACPSGHHQFHRHHRYGNGVCPNGTISSNHGRLHKSLSFAFQSPHHMWGDYPQQPHSCHQAHNFTDGCYSRCDAHRSQCNANSFQGHPSRSRSVPEGLAFASRGCDCHWATGRCAWPSTGNCYSGSGQPLQVVEQITTSV